MFLYYTYPQYLHSDSASYILLAEDILRSGTWLPQSWHYVSGSISIVDVGQIALPFVKWLGITPLALACAATVGASILVAAMYYLGRTLGLDKAASACAALLVISGPSMLYLDLVLGYMMSAVLAQNVLFLAMVCKVVDGKFSRRYIIVAAMLLALLFASNPKKAFAFTLLPSACAAIACWLSARIAGEQVVKEMVRRRDWLLRAIVAAVVVGTAFHVIAADFLSINTSYARHQLISNSAQFIINARTLWRLALEFLGITNLATNPNGIVHSLGTIYRVALIVTVAAAFVFVSARAFRLRQRSRMFLVSYVFFGTGLITGALLVGEPIKEHYGIYYLVFTLIPVAIILILAMGELPKKYKSIAVTTIISPVLLLSTGSLVLSSLTSAQPIYSGPGINQKTTNADKENLIRWLGENGIHHGYAPFWDANAITVLSKGRVRVIAARLLYGDGISPIRWLVSDEKITGVQAETPVFMALHNNTFSDTAIAQCFGTRPSYLVRPYRVVIFHDGVTDCLSAPPAVALPG
ncbi:hypothetical protein [Novilysobacter avium]|uniref:Glycosyltransferase RgtA/B/C/D-like domain-containing protein n=1 Tax=Novilysobacter avium TaxID=2781023 RepID=A0A7S6ZU10_9GAMM|nr:hypothetical protein [Lysobacter avium]QOW21545.1 hypothetical protein INQ42_09850 [Lysobacter avium]